MTATPWRHGQILLSLFFQRGVCPSFNTHDGGQRFRERRKERISFFQAQSRSGKRGLLSRLVGLIQYKQDFSEEMKGGEGNNHDLLVNGGFSRFLFGQMKAGQMSMGESVL
jgi:hypothetical protein